jgi:hypothetical protein
MRISLLSVLLAGAAGCAAAQDAGEEIFTGEVTDNQSRVDFTFELAAGELVTLTTDSDENFDTILALTGPNGQLIDQNDDYSQEHLQSRIVFQSTSAGTYTASVTGYGGSTGSFELEVYRGVDFGLSDDAEILSEDTVTLSAGQFTSTVPVELSEGDIFVATTYALTQGLDTTLMLRGPDGTTISQNDDRGDGSLNSQIVIMAESAGRYEVVVGSYGGSEQGELMLSLAIDPNAEVPFDFTSIEGEQIASYEGALGDNQESMEYPVQLTEGQTLYVLADATSGDLDTVLRLTGADGYPVAMNDDRGDGSLNSAFAYTVPESGTYTLEISRYDGTGSSGTYSLVLSSVDASAVDILREIRENVVSLSGEAQTIRSENFIVYYTTEGDDAATPEYAQAVSDTFEEMLAAQEALGWAAPVRDSDGLYIAYIADAGGVLGVTYPVESVFDNPSTPDVREERASRGVLLVENDFAGLGKEAGPMSLMRATVTHELNHGVQYGYDAQEGLNWLYEATATWLEVATAGVDQDATDYVRSDYRSPQRCWTTAEGGHTYSQWTLLQSIADMYGDGLIVRIWENAVELDGFETMSATLDDVNATIPDVVERWRAQNFALDYDLAPLFDTTVRREAALYAADRWSVKGGLEQLGANYFEIGFDGRYTVSLSGDENLAMTALGQRDGEIHVVPLGASGVIDTAGWDYLGLMVFNRAMPEAPGQCSGSGYTLDFAPANSAMASAAYTFDGTHFTPPTENEPEEDEDESDADAPNYSEAD